MLRTTTKECFNGTTNHFYLHINSSIDFLVYHLLCVYWFIIYRAAEDWSLSYLSTDLIYCYLQISFCNNYSFIHE